MVYLTASSTTNLASVSSSYHQLINSGVVEPSIIIHSHSPRGSGHSLNRLDHFTGTLPSKIHPSTRFQKFQKQRLHQSQWTLDHRNHYHQEYQQRQDLFEDEVASISESGMHQQQDASLLLLTPYSKSCYLMAQRSRTLMTQSKNQMNKSKSMSNLRNSNHQQQSNDSIRLSSSSCTSSSSAASSTHDRNGTITNVSGDGRQPRRLSLTLSSTAVGIQPVTTRQQPRTKQQILRAKHRASILWLIAKANDNGKIPTELRDPFYRDHQGQELLKPWITQRMANAELYGRALANIYGVPDYSSLSHQNILQLLTRRGVFNDQLGLSELGEHITETMLLKNCPVKLAAHMIIIECIMMLYIREILIPIKVMEVTNRFSGEDINGVYTELPPTTEPEDVALYWVNRACTQMNHEIARFYLEESEQVADEDFQCPVEVPSLEELSDMCDGCSLFALMAFYCPNHVDWREICLKQDISIADSIYNLQRIQYFCQQLFPSDICFLLLEDFLYLPESIVPNFLAFIADLLFMFEIQPVDSVTPPYLRLYPEMYQEEYQPTYPQMLTPSEMKAKSLKSSWNNNDSIETSSGGSGGGVVGSEYPPNHPIYDRPSFTQQQRVSSNLTLNYHQGTSSRRNSLNKSLNHRSMFSNGNDSTNHQHEQSPDVEENVYVEPTNVNTVDYPANTDASNVTQLSQYFSSMNLNNNSSNHHLNQPLLNNVIIDNNNEYLRNRSRASGGHLTDYFSNLSNVNDPLSMSTHVRAQRQHPNNADNVKQLLTHQPNDHHPYHLPTDGQTNSSDNSSVAEMSEYSTDQIRAQLNEKRKQIEADRQHERQKRASSDHNFRQEVLKTLKQQQDLSQTDTMDFASSHKSQNPDDENLTFEIHELNPIRREKTFTSIPSSLSTSSMNNSQLGVKTSTFVRKNLFSASEDLKASISDLNYANAKDYHQHNVAKPSADMISVKGDIKQETRTSETTPESTEQTKATIVSPVSDKPDIATESESSPSQQQNQPQTIPPQQPIAQQQAAPRRSQWGQPMIPLAGQVHAPPQPVAPSHPYNPHPQPPAWSQQTPQPTGNGSFDASTTWYHPNQSPYHPMPPPQPYPYGYGAPPPPPPIRPYDPYGPYVPPPHQDPYMSPISGYSHHSSQMVTNTSSYSIPPQQQPNLVIPNTPNGIVPTTIDNHNSIPPQPEMLPDKASENEQSQQQQTNKLSHHNETFFISFNDSDNQQQQKDRTRRHPKKSEIDENHSKKTTLTRTATQTLVSLATDKEQMAERIKELYNVRRPSNPPVPAVSFVIAADDPLDFHSHTPEDSLIINGLVTNGDGKDHNDEQPQKPCLNSSSTPSGKSEEEMQRKKEAIMKQSLRRRALQESKRIQKEQEMAVKRERERLKREQMERKKEEEREKRAFILDQYKRRKQLAEEIEKNGGVAALQGTVARSSSTLILNRTPGSLQQQQVKMRAGGGTQQRPRPKSLHAALFDECSVALSTISGSVSGSSGRLSASRDEIDDLMSSCGRISSAASTTGGASSHSRPQSAMSSQLCLHSSSTTVSTPTGGGPFGEHSFTGMAGFGTEMASVGGPTSSNFFQEYNGPKLFVKPSQKSNKALIVNAINVVLAGTVNADTNRRVTEVINKCDSKYYLILFRNSGLQYRAIYSYNPEREEVLKLDGIGPKTVNNDMIDKFYKYNSGTKSFTAIQTKHLCVTIDAFTIHNHLWMSKAKQQQLQSTPRRFM